MTNIVSLQDFRSQPRKPLARADVPFSRALPPHEFHGAGGVDCLKPQFEAAALNTKSRAEVRRWLTGTSYMPGAPTGRWFLDERHGVSGVYFERELDRWRFRRKWGGLFSFDERAQGHNERILARRFFAAAAPDNSCGNERVLATALVARPGFRWDEVRIARKGLPYAESVMADPEKLRRIYLMWSGQTLAC